MPRFLKYKKEMINLDLVFLIAYNEDDENEGKASLYLYVAAPNFNSLANHLTGSCHRLYYEGVEAKEVWKALDQEATLRADKPRRTSTP